MLFQAVVISLQRLAPAFGKQQYCARPVRDGEGMDRQCLHPVSTQVATMLLATLSNTFLCGHQLPLVMACCTLATVTNTVVQSFDSPIVSHKSRQRLLADIIICKRLYLSCLSGVKRVKPFHHVSLL